MKYGIHRLTNLFLSVLLSASLIGCSSTQSAGQTQTSAPVSGTYTGTSEGYHGPVTVSVTLKDNVITDVSVVDEKDSEGVSDVSFSETPTRILTAQTWDVDICTGATFSSNAVKYAVKNALETAGVLELIVPVKADVSITQQTLQADVVVVGAGLSGLSAAIEAKNAGADVLVLEKLDRIGGSAMLSGGIVYATGSPVNIGEDNDVEDLYQYWMDRSDGVADPILLRIAAESSGDSVKFLMDNGVTFELTRAMGTSPKPRGHYAANDTTGGAEIMTCLEKSCADLGIRILCGTPATELIQDETGAVIGVKAASKTIEYTVNAGTIILCTGGFDASEEMKALYAPVASGVTPMSSVGNVGDAITMGKAVGASMEFHNSVIGVKTINPHLDVAGSYNMLNFMPQLGVTAKGARFQNEVNDYPIAYLNMKEAGGDVFYWIFDSSSEYTVGLCELALADGYGYKANTLDEVTSLAGFDTNVFAATVARYNHFGEIGVDADFGRTGIVPLASSGPYYAIPFVKTTCASLGGLMIDENAGVLSETTGEAIPGLYAAGECASGQFFNKEYPASGSMLTVSITFGRIAGRTAAEK